MSHKQTGHIYSCIYLCVSIINLNASDSRGINLLTIRHYSLTSRYYLESALLGQLARTASLNTTHKYKWKHKYIYINSEIM